MINQPNKKLKKFMNSQLRKKLKLMMS